MYIYISNIDTLSMKKYDDNNQIKTYTNKLHRVR